MSHTRVKTIYDSQGPYASTEIVELYCDHNHTSDIVTFYDVNGNIEDMIFGEWSINGNDKWDAMLRLWFPFKDKWGGELKDGVEYCGVFPWKK